MKRWLTPLLLTIALAIAVPYLTSLSNDHGGYRLSGVQLMDQASATPVQRAHSSALPLPALVARWGINTFTEWPKFETVAFLNSIAIGIAIGVVGMATAQLGGFTAGLVAVLLMLSFPGSLFHGRVVGPEAMTMLAFSLLLWAGTRGAKTVQGALFGTLALLAAMASHHEAVIIALPWLAAAIMTAQKDPKALSPAALIPLLAAPLILSAIWPFLQSGGSSSWVQAFVSPHIEPHAPIIVLGEIRNQSLASAPTFLDGVLLILLRVPVVTAVLALLGATCIARACKRGQLPWQRYFVPLSCLSLIGVQSLNGSPYYDGSDGALRWLPALAMMGGIGAARLQLAILQNWPHKIGIKANHGLYFLLILLLLPGAFGTARTFPQEPNFYNAIVGGLQNAEALGLESQADTYMTKSTLAAINSALPPNARLAYRPRTTQYRELLDRLRKQGLLRPDIESAEPYHATHLAVPRTPAYPAYDKQSVLENTPIFTVDQLGIRQLSLYTY